VFQSNEEGEDKEEEEEEEEEEEAGLKLQSKAEAEGGFESAPESEPLEPKKLQEGLPLAPEAEEADEGDEEEELREEVQSKAEGEAEAAPGEFELLLPPPPKFQRDDFSPLAELAPPLERSALLPDGPLGAHGSGP
jgi:hypothetical protein